MLADTFDQITPEFFQQALGQFAQMLAENEQKINDLNVYPVPDSDTGTNSLLTLRAGLSEMSGKSVAGLVSSLAVGAADQALGNSGVILAAYFSGLAAKLTDKHQQGQLSVNRENWQAALASAARNARESVLHPTQGTILTVADSVLEPVSQALGDQLIQNSKIARNALAKTQSQLPELTQAGVVDAGAVVMTLFHDSFAKLVLGEKFNSLFVAQPDCQITGQKLSPTYSGPMHELMFTIAISETQKNDLIYLLESAGDSIALTESATTDSKPTKNYRVHIHCDLPDELIKQVKVLGDVNDLILVNLKLKTL